ncbi:MAG TPA: caspase family protein [Fluviicola sp.]|nr:caspase family protein [Fluviicola sp.]
MKGHALLIGVNEVNKDHYGEELDMACAITDVAEMKSIFEQIPSFQNNTKIFESSSASWKNVKHELGLLSKTSQTEEGYLVIYYTGHGASLPKDNKLNEKQGFFCFYDRMVIEQEIRNELLSFHENFKILLISDSCHSGELNTWDKDELYMEFILAYPELELEFNFDLITPKTKSIQHKRFERIYNYNNNSTFYNNLTRETASINFNPKADVAILTACDWDQITEQNLVTNGLSVFTRIITNLWNNNKSITYPEFVTLLQKKRPLTKQPQFEVSPINHSDFFIKNFVFVANQCEDNIWYHLEETNGKLIKLNPFSGIADYHYMYSYSWYTDETHSQLTDVLEKLEAQGCYLPINDELVLGVVYVNEHTSPKSFPQEIVGMKSDPGAPEYGYVVIIDFYSDVILYKGRTKGKVSNTIGG